MALLNFVGINGSPEFQQAGQVVGFVFLAQAHGFGQGRLVLGFGHNLSGHGVEALS